jgi:hypothetical protein
MNWGDKLKRNHPPKKQDQELATVAISPVYEKVAITPSLLNRNLLCKTCIHYHQSKRISSASDRIDSSNDRVQSILSSLSFNPSSSSYQTVDVDVYLFAFWDNKMDVMIHHYTVQKAQRQNKGSLDSMMSCKL